MQQLALDVRLADHAVFESFHPGRNGLAMASLEAAAEGRGPSPLWVWGPRESGRSHLLQASVARSGGSAAYLPLAALQALSPEVLDGMDAYTLVAIDDVTRIAGDPAWERGLFRLYEQLAARGARLLLAGDGPPQQAGYRLADLASRFAAGAVFRLERMTDEECVDALRLRAEWRGLTLPEETARFLLTRVERGTGSLFQLLDRLDRAALSAQRALTVPFVRSVLEDGP